MEESSVSIQASNLEAVMSIEPEGEENMPGVGVGVGCSRSEQEGEDVLGILKSFMESEEIPSLENMFQLGEPLF
jgi:hypothetical protein